MAQYVYSMYQVGKIVPPKREILKNISLSFFPGAKIGVLGLNGAGKSTLLRIMAGVDTDIEGEARPMPGIKVGYLPQEPDLDPDKTVREIVEESVADPFVESLIGIADQSQLVERHQLVEVLLHDSSLDSRQQAAAVVAVVVTGLVQPLTEVLLVRGARKPLPDSAIPGRVPARV